MKYIIQSMIFAAMCLGTAYVYADDHETKQVCVNVQKDGKDVIDPKTKQPKQNCKEVKQHKKLETK